MTYICGERFTVNPPGTYKSPGLSSGLLLGGVLVVYAVIRYNAGRSVLPRVRRRLASVLLAMMACVAMARPAPAFAKDPSAQPHAGRSQHHSVHLAWHPPANSRKPVAGYNIYRSSNAGKSFSRVNALPIPKPEYDDATVRSGATYLYVVKSVDKKGAESGPSNKFRITVP